MSLALFEADAPIMTGRCDAASEEFECSLPAGHAGEHRGHVSHDLTRAYVVVGAEHWLHEPTGHDHADGSGQ